MLGFFRIVKDYYVEIHLQSESCRIHRPIIDSKLNFVFRGRKSQIRGLKKEINKLIK